MGHTIARHVGRTPEQLIARLSEPRAPHISASFKNIRQAELIISEVLSVKSRQIEYALKYTHTRATLVHAHRFNFLIGTYVERGATEVKRPMVSGSSSGLQHSMADNIIWLRPSQHHKG